MARGQPCDLAKQSDAGSKQPATRRTPRSSGQPPAKRQCSALSPQKSFAKTLLISEAPIAVRRPITPDSESRFSCRARALRLQSPRSRVVPCDIFGSHLARAIRVDHGRAGQGRQAAPLRRSLPLRRGSLISGVPVPPAWGGANAAPLFPRSVPCPTGS